MEMCTAGVAEGREHLLSRSTARTGAHGGTKRRQTERGRKRVHIAGSIPRGGATGNRSDPRRIARDLTAQRDTFGRPQPSKPLKCCEGLEDPHLAKSATGCPGLSIKLSLSVAVRIVESIQSVQRSGTLKE